MKKVMFIFGTRPEFIKIYPIIMEAKKQQNETVIVNTGQHKEMVNELLEQFEMEVDYDLQIMSKCNNLTDILSFALTGIDLIIKKEKPDVVFVHGDTSTTLAGALCSFYNNTKLAHIEAGLRTYNMKSPFPEESNRQIVGLLADYHFAPTEQSGNNLLSEGKKASSIHVVGNSAIDMLKYTIDPNHDNDLLKWKPEKKLILMTAHRRENLSDLEDIFRAINEIAEMYREGYKIIYPIHMNPFIREKASLYLNNDNIKIIEPLDTIAFHNLMSSAHLILTDSGGIQEEAPSLGIPVLVLRDETERPEGVEAGTLQLIGTTYEAIVNSISELLNDTQRYNEMSRASNPYGDGNTASQIIEILNR